ncbi:hypothetical protein QNI16_27695 [Cytophagaceae bacterium YF14B1]|uniref:Uncharacterized protein n=1 Tax=Xanthocytophaga flava TaxID=3048013 RepID=A0AAE3QRV4_9BACT|nr:hypothetical protein [Xanthocytophaga flavus]MDJ1484312.1 hypothetical protein [Xanthocytophaga flavus]
MDSTVRYELHGTSWLLVNNTDSKSLLAVLGIDQTERTSWRAGLDMFIKMRLQERSKCQTRKDRNSFDEKSNYPLIIYQLSDNWTMVYSHYFYPQDRIVSICCALSKQYSKAYHFLFDSHCGYRRWLICEDGQMKRYCEEDEFSVVTVI